MPTCLNPVSSGIQRMRRLQTAGLCFAYRAAVMSAGTSLFHAENGFWLITDRTENARHQNDCVVRGTLPFLKSSNTQVFSWIKRSRQPYNDKTSKPRLPSEISHEIIENCVCVCCLDTQGHAYHM